MEIPASFKEHMPKLFAGGGVGAGGGIVFFAIFKDSIREWMTDWRDERRAKRAERLASIGHYERAMTELLKMLKEMIASQHAQEKETIVLLGQMATSHERSVDIQRVTSNQVKDVFDRLTRIEGRIGVPLQ
jgi:hypothetical protein